ncbi:hypothetical protein MCOL_V214034 [Mycobacterium colombiense CECT 3035]|uniref:Uncharacterized protein n=1 Tax=Mycobacterium colombiense CECT 3035 TaxID=1041522 RepID=J4SFN8_9MYCO|nr:hypothetical protein MCOL_V214034 [Mycobacterium colombiense CECT 3035]
MDGHEMMERDAEIARLREQCVSFRGIAERLGCSLGSVQKAVGRINRRSASAPSAPVVSVSSPADPILRLLSPDDLCRLGMTAQEVERGLDSLTRYRFLGLPEGSLAGDRARALFDHGRNAEEFTVWMEGGTTGRAVSTAASRP